MTEEINRLRSCDSKWLIVAAQNTRKSEVVAPLGCFALSYFIFRFVRRPH